MSFIGLIMSMICVGAAIGVVGFRNPLYSAFSLVVNLLAVAGLYALLEAHFLAVSQVVVYAGAIMVLVLFVLMLLNVKSESGRKLGVIRSAVAIGAGGSILLSVIPTVLRALDRLSPSQLVDRARASQGGVGAIGQELFSKYLLEFEISSVVLLVGVVGAVMLAKRKTVQLAPRQSGSVQTVQGPAMADAVSSNGNAHRAVGE